MLTRRGLIGSMTAGATMLAAPAIVRAEGDVALRFVPGADLSTLDPIWSTQFLVRTAALMVWDTMYGVDHSFTAQPQMAEAHEVSDDGKTWAIRLRPGLVFHDGERVTSRDVVASLHRWMARDGMGGRIRDRLDALEAVDDRTVRFRLNQPFPKLLFALGKGSTPVAFIMPERIAVTDPFKQISEYVGSGPMTIRRDEWLPGGQVVFHKFDRYVSRDEPADWLAGGKRMAMERVEWRIITDPGTAGAAIRAGEVDWLETPLNDLIPTYKRDPALRAEVTDPAGAVGIMRLNHLQPPFTDVRARQAVQMATDQSEFMRAVVGDDTSLWRTLPSVFPPASPGYTEAGSDRLKGPRDYARARALLAEAGYRGEPIVLLVAAEVPIFKAMGDLTADTLQKIGMTVDYVATDWGTVNQRQTNKGPASKGGWHIFNTWSAGADLVTPATSRPLLATGDRAWFGWPDSAAVRDAMEAWYSASDPVAEKQAMVALNEAAMDNVTFIPTGFFQAYQVWRANVTGVPHSPYITFWDVKKG